MKASLIVAILIVMSCAGTMQRRGDPIVRVPVLSDAERAQGCRFIEWANGLLELRCPDYSSMRGRRHGESIITTQRFCSAVPPGGRVKGIYRNGVLVGCQR